MSRSPAVEYALKDIGRRGTDKKEAIEKSGLDLEHLPQSLAYVQIATIEYFAEHLDEIYGKFEQQQKENTELREYCRVATEAIEELGRRIRVLESWSLC